MDGERKISISKDIETNLKIIKETLIDCDDIVYRPITVGKTQKYNLAIIYTDGLADKELVSNFALEPLLHEAREEEPSPNRVKYNLYDLIKKANLAITEIGEVETLNEVVDKVLIGETVLLINNYEKVMVLSSRGWPMRGVNEPQIETVVRGPRDGFNETLKVNTSLIRRRIRDPKLKVKNMQLGVRSKTDVALMYIEDIVDGDILKEVNKRLKSIKIDAILESGNIEHLIEDNRFSPFPQCQSTERPDAVAAGIYEGRVAIVVDNTPFALMVPSTVNTLLQSPEDYYDRWLISSLIRLIRYFAMAVALLFPALYIAMTAYHPGMLPTQLAIYVAATRVTVPFPAFVEAFIMEGTIELLREAGARLSGPIGTTIGIVGGLVIGQAAVEAGIVSPLMVIIVAVTTISSFVIPNYSFATGFRFIRFIIMALAAVLGLYGIMLGLILLASHLVTLKSFGVPYTNPFTNIGRSLIDLKDSFIKIPIKDMTRRPIYTKVTDKDRKPYKESNDKDEDNDS